MAYFVRKGYFCENYDDSTFSEKHHSDLKRKLLGVIMFSLWEMSMEKSCSESINLI